MNLDDVNYKNSYPYEEILSILKGDNEEEKAFSLIFLDKIQNKTDFELFISHLTNHDGRIREIVSSKLLEIMPLDFIEEYKEKLIDALLDVNPNVSRNIVEFLRLSGIKIKDEIFSRISVVSKEIEEKSRPKKWKTQKNHLLTKKYFNLYWLLEAIAEIFDETFECEFLDKVLRENSDNYDYTIREKVAKILTKMKNPNLELLQKMQHDENYYVKLNFYANISDKTV